MTEERHRKALALMVCLFIGYMYLETIWKPYFYGRQVVVLPSQQPVTALTNNESSLNAQAANVNNALPQETITQKVQQSEKIQVSTKDLKFEIALLGGRVTKVELLNYKKDLKKKSALNLVELSENSPYPLGAVVNGNDDTNVIYQILAPSTLRQVSGQISSLQLANEQATVFLKGTFPDGTVVKKKLTFQPKGYLVDVSIEVENGSPQTLSTYWTKTATQEEISNIDPYKSVGFVWFDGQKALRKTFKDLKSAGAPENVGKVNWVSLGDKYFTTALISSANANISFSNDTYFASISNNPNIIDFKLFAGPKSFELLQKVGFELQREIDFGKFAIVSAPLLSLLHFFFSLFKNYGLAIVTLTILVRLALYPLNSASFKQMKAMQDIKPELDRIKETIKDKQQQQLAMMELYKKKGVNPLGGCLPVLLQMPIFLGLYAALSLAVELRHAHFAGWIDDLSAPERLMIAGYGIPVMVILFVLSMMVQQWITPTAVDPAQKKAMMIMPAVMGFMFANFPAGLTLYWLTSNLISIGQQKAMQHSHENGKSPLAITVGVSVVVFLLAFAASMF